MVPNAAILGTARDESGAARIEGATWGVDIQPATLELVEAGPLRAMVRLRAPEAIQGLDLVARLHFYLNQPYARRRVREVSHGDVRAVRGLSKPLVDEHLQIIRLP